MPWQLEVACIVLLLFVAHLNLPIPLSNIENGLQARVLPSNFQQVTNACKLIPLQTVCSSAFPIKTHLPANGGY